jgi:hypothetical protein
MEGKMGASMEFGPLSLCVFVLMDGVGYIRRKGKEFRYSYQEEGHWGFVPAVLSERSL